MSAPVINLHEKLNKFKELWSPKIIARLNDYHFKLVRIKGEFVWHSHPETDEAFLVIEGRMGIEFRNESIFLEEGELAVIPRGVEHRPFARTECRVLLFEPAGTINTGQVQGDLTAPDDVWI